MPFFSPSTRGFYRKEIHGENMPADAVEITDKRHAKLLREQREGREIVHTEKGPAGKAHKPQRPQMLELCARRVKREARKRILAVASIERQSNDNAELAIAALSRGGTGAHFPALARRERIDAIRAASNAIESELSSLTADELVTFNAARSPLWPIG